MRPARHGSYENCSFIELIFGFYTVFFGGGGCNHYFWSKATEKRSPFGNNLSYPSNWNACEPGLRSKLKYFHLVFSQNQFPPQYIELPMLSF